MKQLELISLNIDFPVWDGLWPKSKKMNAQRYYYRTESVVIDKI